MHIDVALINESQLGNRLNHAIEHNRRGEFGLLLSMLSNDARDMAQFQFDKALATDDRLRKQLQLPGQEVLLADLSKEQQVQDNSQAFTQGGAVNFHLQQALTPEALLIRGQHDNEMAQALANCDNLTRLRQAGLMTEVKQTVPHFVDQLTEQRTFALAV